jgi:hypothetical protein
VFLEDFAREGTVVERVTILCAGGHHEYHSLVSSWKLGERKRGAKEGGLDAPSQSSQNSSPPFTPEAADSGRWFVSEDEAFDLVGEAEPVTVRRSASVRGKGDEGRREGTNSQDTHRAHALHRTSRTPLHHRP